MLAVFPAGEVSHIHLRQMEIVDPEWNLAAARIIRLTGAEALPVFFEGRNSVTFQAMGHLHPGLRSTWLLNEFLGQKGKKVEVRIGSAVPAEVVRHAGTAQEATNYLRWRAYLLAQRGGHRFKVPPMLQSVLPRLQQKNEPVAAGVTRDALIKELESFRPEQLLEENREFSVYLAEAGSIPNFMRELGRLREITFRSVGEGTGKSTDLDGFDAYYKHVLLWSKHNLELVGAYRMGVTSEILPSLDIAGLYTSTLFRYDPRFFQQLGPALELGRSFIRPEYQRQYAPLLMLWKGIGRYLAAHPELAVLFGAVSISSRYNRVSRELIVRFFQARERQSRAGRRWSRRAVPSIPPGFAPEIVPQPAPISRTCKTSPTPSAISKPTAKAFPYCSSSMRNLAAAWSASTSTAIFPTCSTAWCWSTCAAPIRRRWRVTWEKMASKAFRRYHGLDVAGEE